VDAGSGALVPKGFFRGHGSRVCSLKVAVSGDSVVCLCLLSMPLSNQAEETQKRFGHDDFMDVRQLSPLATTDWAVRALHTQPCSSCPLPGSLRVDAAGA
jgi:hypothetical protein